MRANVHFPRVERRCVHYRWSRVRQVEACRRVRARGRSLNPRTRDQKLPNVRRQRDQGHARDRSRSQHLLPACRAARCPQAGPRVSLTAPRLRARDMQLPQACLFADWSEETPRRDACSGRRPPARRSRSQEPDQICGRDNAHMRSRARRMNVPQRRLIPRCDQLHRRAHRLAHA